MLLTFDSYTITAEIAEQRLLPGVVYALYFLVFWTKCSCQSTNCNQMRWNTCSFGQKTPLNASSFLSIQITHMIIPRINSHKRLAFLKRLGVLNANTQWIHDGVNCVSLISWLLPPCISCSCCLSSPWATLNVLPLPPWPLFVRCPTFRVMKWRRWISHPTARAAELHSQNWWSIVSQIPSRQTWHTGRRLCLPSPGVQCNRSVSC